MPFASARALVESQAHATWTPLRVGAQERAAVQPRIGTVHPHLEGGDERSERAAVPHDDDFAIGRLEQVKTTLSF